MTTITTNVGSPGTISFAGGGRTYAINNISTTPIQVIGDNPARQSIVFHNPGAVDIFIAPVYSIVNGSDALLTPSTGALGGCYRVYANGGTLTITGECQKAWQGFSASGSNNPLTVTASNV